MLPDKQQPVVATIDDASLEQIDLIAEALRKRDMAVERVMPLTGVVTGYCHPKQLAALRQVKGVLSVELDQPVQLPPDE